MDVIRRHAPRISGRATGQPIVFVHGFGCDSSMWRYVAPRYERYFQVITFDLVGHGESDPDDFDAERYSTLDGYASDLIELCRALDLVDVILVAHSVSAMIGALAAAREPKLFAKLVMIGPSPRYIDDADYHGGFSTADISDLLDSLESNYLGWSSTMAPVIVGNSDRPELGDELTASFCRTDPLVAKHFARVTFLSDNRPDLARVTTPTLVLQCRHDVIAPVYVGEYVRDHLADASYRVLDATGHCPHLSAPDATSAAIDEFLGVVR